MFKRIFFWLPVAFVLAACTPQLSSGDIKNGNDIETNTTNFSARSFINESDIFALLGESETVVDLATAKEKGKTFDGNSYFVFANNDNDLSWGISTCRGKIYSVILYNTKNQHWLRINNSLVMQMSEDTMLSEFGENVNPWLTVVAKIHGLRKETELKNYAYKFTTNEIPGITSIKFAYIEGEYSKPWSVVFNNRDICKQ